ncbi:MAG: hypothetical protein HKN13_13890 [Rhodothermales bacterium]|nr:hypothetical protein [Rhodothermales bacterium]
MPFIRRRRLEAGFKYEDQLVFHVEKLKPPFISAIRTTTKRIAVPMDCTIFSIHRRAAVDYVEQSLAGDVEPFVGPTIRTLDVSKAVLVDSEHLLWFAVIAGDAICGHPGMLLGRVTTAKPVLT